MRVTHERLLVVVVVLAVGAAAGIGLLWPSGGETPEPTGEFVDETELRDARLTAVTEIATDLDHPSLLPGATLVEVTAEFADTGEVVTFEITDETGDTYRAGQQVRVASVPSVGDGILYYVSDFRRGVPMAVLALMFVGAVLAFGRFQGLRALTGLALTFALILLFIIPAILDGRSPVTVALVGSLAIMIVTLYLSHGFNPKTSAAVVGTAGALLLTVALAGLFTSAASITGFTSEDARLANFEVGGLSLRGLLLAGIIIGGLGVLDDVTMSQASTVFALRRANPTMPFGRLFSEGLSVGRDHIAATVNTLFLAYAGAALPLLILLTTGHQALGTVLTSEIVAVEVVRTLVGSLGLIAAVPVTTALAAAVAPTAPTEAAPTEATPTETTPTEAASAEAGSQTESPPPAGAPSAGTPAARAAADHDPDEDDDLWVRRLRSAYRLPSEDA